MCDVGYSGDQCQIESPCPGKPVCGGLSHGTCNTNTGECECLDDYGGLACEAELATALRRVVGGKSVAGVLPHTACRFPFTHKNKTHHDCAVGRRGPGDHAEWCKTPGNGWGYCAPRGTCGGSKGKECSGYGQCVQLYNAPQGAAVCECDDGWDGNSCELKLVRVVLGVEWSGSSTDATALSGLECRIPFTFRGHEYSDCTTFHSPDDGLPRCLANLTQLSDPSSNPTTVFVPCAPRGTCPGQPVQCSGHGSCGSYGRCECDNGFVGLACTPPAQLNKANPLQPLQSVVASATGTPSKNDTLAAVAAIPLPANAMHIRPVHGPGIASRIEAEKERATRLVYLATIHSKVVEAFFDALNGAEWVNKSGWSERGHGTTGICEAHGVECDDQSSVVGLRLGGNGLDGTIPDELRLLANVTDLDLRNNAILGPIPSSLCQLKQLEKLVVSSNKLRGQLPECLRALPHLVSVDVTDNILSGDVTGWRVWEIEEASLLQVSAVADDKEEEKTEAESEKEEVDIEGKVVDDETEKEEIEKEEEVVDVTGVIGVNVTAPPNLTSNSSNATSSAKTRKFKCKENCMAPGSPSASLCPRRASGCPAATNPK